MTDKQDDIATLILKQLQELRDDASDFKADMIEDLKEIKVRLPHDRTKPRNARLEDAGFMLDAKTQADQITRLWAALEAPQMPWVQYKILMKLVIR